MIKRRQKKKTHEPNSIRMKLIAVYLLMFCFAVSVSLIGQMREPIRKFYNVSIEWSNLLLSAQSIGGVVIAVISILFIDSLNQRKIIILAGMMMAFTLMSIAILPPFAVTALIFTALGLSAGTVNTLSNSVIVGISKKHKKQYLTIMHMAFSVGAFIMPLISQIILDLSGLQNTFLIIGSVMIMCTLAAMFSFRKELRTSLKTDRLHIKYRFSEMVKVIRIPGIKQIFIIAVLISIWQMCAIYNLSGGIASVNGNPSEGAYALSTLFLGMVVSRLLYSRVADKFSPGIVLAVMNTVGAGFWIGAMLVPDVTAKTILIALSTLVCGINFPTVYSTACSIAYKNTATASGLIAFGYYLAIFIFSPIIGNISDIYGYQTGLITLALPLLLVLPMGLLLHRKMRVKFKY